MSSSSSSLDDNSVRIRDHAITSTSETTEQTTETIKDVARDIVEASSSIRELISNTTSHWCNGRDRTSNQSYT